MRRGLKKIISSITMVAVLTSFVIQPAYAATRLTPLHLYRWARMNNYSRLHQFKKYINLQDQNHNTALCLAQQAKDQNAYITLLKFGASTDVACHDDDDTICAAIVATEKSSISPAWLLLGAGAIGAAALIGSGGGGGDKEKLCDKNLYPFDETCPDGKVKTEECQDSKGTHLQCICDTNQFPFENSCPTGMISASTCTDDNGSHHSCICDKSNGYFEDQNECTTNNSGQTGYDCSAQTAEGCYIRTPLSCPLPEVTECEQAKEGIALNDTTTNNFAGESACHNCSYSCDTSKNYDTSCPEGYDCTGSDISQGDASCVKPVACDNKTQYTTCPDGKNCSSTTNYGITCYQVLSDKCDRTTYKYDTPCPNTTGLKTIDTCTETTTSGTYTYYQCACDDVSGYYDPSSPITTCGDSGNKGWEFTSNTYNGITCLQCTPLTCDINDGLYSKCTDAKTGIILTPTPSTTDFNGDTPCYECEYDCDIVNNYATSCPSGYSCVGSEVSQGDANCQKPVACNETTQFTTCPDGKNCLPITNYGITCYQVLSDKCDRDIFVYDTPCTDTTGLKTVNTCSEQTANGTFTYYQCACNDASGYYDTTAPITTCGSKGANGWEFITQNYNGINCNTCNKLECAETDYGYGTPNCPTYSDLKGSSSLSATYHGQEQCYTCNYSCKQGLYDDLSECNQDAAAQGKVCTSTTTTVKDGSSITCYAIDTCNPAEYPYDNQCPLGMTTIKQCSDANGSHHACICDESSNYFTDKTACELNENLEVGYDCSSQTPEGCYLRTALTCEAPSTKSCDTAKDGIILDDQLTGKYAGEVACHNCTYTCDTSKNYTTSCPEGYSCVGSEVSQGDASCVKPVACDEKTQYATCPDGKNCSSTTNYGITCYKVLGDTCDRAIYKYDEQCETTEGLKTADYCDDVTANGTFRYYQCACNDDDGYYDNSTTDLKTCGSSGANGWIFNSQTYNGITCKTCQMLDCAETDYGYGTPNCPTYPDLKTSSSLSSQYHGNDQCYSCNYTCKDGLYSDEADCTDDAEVMGKTCTSTTTTVQDGRSYTCYKIDECNPASYPYDNQCPTGMKEVTECTDDNGSHYSCTCDEDNGYYQDQGKCSLNSNNLVGYDCSNKTTEGCYIRTELTCIDPEVTSCDTAKDGIILDDKLTGKYAGETACHTCEYTCDTAKNYNTTCPAGYDCTGSNVSQGTATCVKPVACDETTQYAICPDGYNCSSTINYGITCYKVLGAACDRTVYKYDEQCETTEGLKTADYCDDVTANGTFRYYQCACDTDNKYYDNSTTDLKTCGSSGSNGWEFVSQNYNGITCKTCQELDCLTTDYGYGAQNCPTVAGLTEKATSSSAYHGNEQCYSCSYTCDPALGYYDNEDDCNDDASVNGKTCASESFTTYNGSVTCYKEATCDKSIYTFDSACPEGMTKVSECTDTSTHYQCEPNNCSAYTETSCSIGTKISDECTTNNATGTAPTTTYKCECDEEENYFPSSATNLTLCGLSGSNGWKFSSSTTISGVSCKTCQELDCLTTDYGYGAQNCPTVAGLTEKATSSSAYHGNEQCYSCSYTCDPALGYYDNEDDCNDDASVNGKTCASETFTTYNGNKTCYKEALCDTSTYNFQGSCPSGMTETARCSDTSGDHLQCEPNDCSAYTETSCSTGTTISDECTTNNATGTAPKTTYKCECNSSKGYYDSTSNLSVCGSSAEKGWEFISGTYNNLTCSTCSELECNNAEGFYSTCESAKTGITLTATKSTTNFHGNTACNTCQYTCDTAKNYNTTCPAGYDCTGSNVSQGTATCVKPVACDETTQYATCPDGYNCSSTTNYGITCYKVLGTACDRTVYKYDEQCETTEGLKTADYCDDVTANGTFRYYQCACDTDNKYYDNSTTDLKTCGNSGSNGWEFVSQNYNGITCKTCQELDCLTTDYGYGAQNCPTVAGLTEKATSSSAYHGDDQCYSCSYTCDPKLGYYSDIDDCNDDAAVNGKICASETFTTYNGSITCYKEATCDKSIYTFDSACPEGMTKVSECTDTSTHYQCKPVDCSEYPFNSCTLGTKSIASCTTNTASGSNVTTTYQCGCDTENKYYETTADVSVCETTGAKGWELVSGTYNTLTCKTCSELECNNAEGFYETCESAKTGITLTATKSTTNFHGNTACYTCEYTCDTAKNYNTTCPTGYNCTGSNVSQGTATCVKPVACDETTQYATCPDGYNCSSTTNYGITCYVKLTPKCDRDIFTSSTPCSATYGLTQINSCTETTTSGTYTYYQCGCDSSKKYYSLGSSITSCGNSGSKGWEFVASTVKDYQNNSCYTCRALTCEDNGLNDTCTPAQHGLTLKDETSDTYFEGDEECHQCTYSCDQSVDYYPSCPSGYDCGDHVSSQGNASCVTPINCDNNILLDYNHVITGKVYETITDYGLTCYKEKTGCDNSKGYYSTETECITSNQGCSYDTASGCYLRATACPVNEDLSPTDLSICGTYPDYLKATKVKSGTSGASDCYKCDFKCDTTKANVYTSSTACTQNAYGETGYSCTEDETYGCFIREDVLTCSAPSNTSCEAPQEGFVLDNSPTGSYEGEQPCLACTYSCDETNQYIDTQDYMQCGTSGANGWHFESGITQAGKTCYKCLENDCPTKTTHETCTKVTGLKYKSASTAGITQYHGQTQCHTCVYTCDTSENYYDTIEECEQDSEKTCNTTAVEIYVDLTKETYYCYQPQGSLASQNSSLEKTTNTTLIELTSSGTEDVYGLKSDKDLQNTSDNTSSNGIIKIDHNSTGYAYGMYGSSNNQLLNDENASINIQNNTSGTAVGMYASRGGSAINKGDITITGTTGTSVGILGAGENYIENQGTINVEGASAYGIRVLDGTNTTIINQGSINVNGTNEAYGIYIDQNASANSVTNLGSITINGNQNDTNRSIVLNGADFRNVGLMSVSRELDLETLGAKTVYLEDGATYEAQSIKGDLTAGVSTVMNDNLDTYIKKDALIAEDTNNLNISSESALFEAKTEKNKEGNTDVVLKRKEFSNFTPNKSMADYLTKNYQAKKFEDTFNSLKSATTQSNLQENLADFMGHDRLLNFADENFSVLRSLNRTMADTILKPTNEKNRVIAGYDNFNLETDDKGVLSGYELNSNSMFTFGDKRLNNWSRLGLGLSFTDINTSYEKGGDRDLNIVSVFVPYLRKISDKLNLVSILNLGYGYGDYDRGSDREADIEEIIYGLTNELRYTININGFAELEPALMLNAIGYTEKGFDEGNAKDAIQTKRTNNLSVELGLGVFLKKEVKMEKYGKLGFKIGGVYYHEFADPYRDITLRHKDALGSWYRINDYANLYQRDRAVLEAVIDYAYKDLALYVKYNKLIQKNNPDLFDMGLKFNF